MENKEISKKAANVNYEHLSEEDFVTLDFAGPEKVLMEKGALPSGNIFADRKGDEVKDNMYPKWETELAKSRYEDAVCYVNLSEEKKEIYNKEYSDFMAEHEAFMANADLLGVDKRSHHKDSALMRDVKSSLSELEAFLIEGPGTTNADELTSNASKLENAYKKVITSCKEYGKGREPRTKEGIRRKELVAFILENCEKELSMLQSVEFHKIPGEVLASNDFSWGEVLFYASAIHIPNNIVKKPDSGSMSEVYRVRMKGINGEDEEKFFSVEQKFFSYGILDVLEKMRFDEKADEKDAAYLSKFVGMLKRYNPEQQGYIMGRVFWALSDWKGGRPAKKDAQKRYIAGLRNRYLRGFARDTEMIKQIELLYEDSNERLRERLLSGESHLSENIARVTAGIKNDVYVSRRNVASSIVAESLGLDFIAKSRHAVLEKNGIYVPGNLMDKAEGRSFPKKTDIVPKKEGDTGALSEEGDPVVVEYRNSALKDMVSLQIFDFLCGQTDRHTGNLSYEWNKEGERVVISKVSAFDNDMAFGDTTFSDMLFGRRYSYGLVNDGRRHNSDLPLDSAYFGLAHDNEIWPLLEGIGAVKKLNNLTGIKNDYSYDFSGVRLEAVDEVLRNYYSANDNPVYKMMFSEDGKEKTIKPVIKRLDEKLYYSIMFTDPLSLLARMGGCQISTAEAACFLDRFYGLKNFLIASQVMAEEEGKDFFMKEDDWNKVTSLEEIVSDVKLSVFDLNLGETGFFGREFEVDNAIKR